jgi:hypothetical protein
LSERGGPTTQEGIYYQNTVAARYLVDLLDLSPLPPRERVIEVRVEAPSDVDDIVVRYADGHRDWVQVKTRIKPSADPWTGLWADLAAQRSATEFGSEDHLVVVLGESDATATALRDLCERTFSVQDEVEWLSRLTYPQRELLNAIQSALGAATNALELLRGTTIEIAPLKEIERTFQRRRLGTAFSPPSSLLSTLRDVAGGGARRRALFLAAPLRQRLSTEFNIDVTEPAEWGLPVYRETVERLARIEIPGTGVSGPSRELFVWPRARVYDRAATAGFEDEDQAWDFPFEMAAVNLRAFPSAGLDRCIVVAGPGYGKSALLSAIAARLVPTPYVPVLIPLATFAASDVTVLEFLTDNVNREMDVRADWHRLTEQGLVALLFDGLDEIPAVKRKDVLARIATFSARHARVPWILTVRDPAVVSGAIEARAIELLPLDRNDVVRFAEALGGRVAGVDSREIERRLDAYPDLARLARIPLFLVMLIALTGTRDQIPRNRTDLIEAYLKTLFSPHEHKSVASTSVNASTLRSLAEVLAFERLERQEIGATEREVMDVASRVVPGIAPDVLLAELLTHGVLRRQSATRVQFPYPIVQEYLAARHLLEHRPEMLPNLIDDAVHRPWAQVIQFALEMHPAPGPTIRLMLDRKDDAFATGLRLVGRCVANGAKVDGALWTEVARRLTRFWIYASWRNRERVGRLIADGFSAPLLPEVRSALQHRWLINDGAGEIIVRANEPALTMEVLAALLNGGLDRFMNVRTLQPALDRLVVKVFEMYAARARRTGTTNDEYCGLAHLILQLDSKPLAPGLTLNVALDETLPDIIRLAAFCATAGSLDERAWPIVLRALRSDRDDERWAGARAMAKAADPGESMLAYFHGGVLTLEEFRDLLAHPQALFPDKDRRLDFVKQCLSDARFPFELRDIMLVFAARYGDRHAFEGLIKRLPMLEFQLAGATISLLGHFPFREVGVRAAEAVRIRVNSAEEAASFAQGAVTGLLYLFDMDNLGSGGLRSTEPHPALDVWAALIEGWVDRGDGTVIQRLRLAAAASRLGSDRALGILEQLINRLPHPDDPQFDAEDEYGHHLRSAIDELRNRRRLLPLRVGEEFARASRPNLIYAGIEVIAAHASREALELLLRLYNDSTEWDKRGSLSEAIETLSGRLSLSIGQSGNTLLIA